MARNIDPLDLSAPITDREGRPTPRFARQWVQQFRANIGLLFNSILAGTGLTGGGKLSDGDVTLRLADMAQGTLKGRFSAGVGAPEDMTVAQALSFATTTDLAEGTNLYYTQARFDSAFAAKSTTDLAEGTNLYYTQARFDSAFAAKSTTDLAEGTNLYLTDERAQDAVGGILDNATLGDINFVYDDVAGDIYATIPNQAVTYAKMQNVSATDKLLGRASAGAGVVEEIACTAAGRALIDDNDATAQRATLGLVIGTNLREMLLADRSYFVATTGSDSNDGLSAGSPFLTIQKAIDVIAGTLDIGNFNVTVNIADGTYAGQTDLKSIVGSGLINIVGNETTPANVLIPNTATFAAGFFTAGASGRYRISGMKITSSGSNGFGIFLGGLLNVTLGTLEFGACTRAMLFLNSPLVSCRVDTAAGTTITISGNATQFLECGNQAAFIWNNSATAPDLVLSGTPAFTQFVNLSRNATATFLNFSFSGSATGSRALVAEGAALITASNPDTYLPGSTNAVIKGWQGVSAATKPAAGNELEPFTVAGLPAAGTAGRTAFVTDANSTTFASIVAGGGANGVPVYDDGANWRIG